MRRYKGSVCYRHVCFVVCFLFLFFVCFVGHLGVLASISPSVLCVFVCPFMAAGVRCKMYTRSMLLLHRGQDHVFHGTEILMMSRAWLSRRAPSKILRDLHRARNPRVQVCTRKVSHHESGVAVVGGLLGSKHQGPCPQYFLSWTSLATKLM